MQGRLIQQGRPEGKGPCQGRFLPDAKSHRQIGVIILGQSNLLRGPHGIPHLSLIDLTQQILFLHAAGRPFPTQSRDLGAQALQLGFHLRVMHQGQRIIRQI